MKKRSVISLLVIIATAFSTTLSSFAASLIPSGESIGIVLNYQGIYITGTYDYTIDNQHFNPANQDILAGDLLTHINDVPVLSIEQLANQLQNAINTSNVVKATLIRQNASITRDLQINYDKASDSFKTGLYVKDTTAGIGTMTYYDPQNQTFGSLGHSLNDTTLDLEFAKGEVFDASVNDVVKNTKEKTGEKIAIIEDDKKIGEVKQNSEIGVFGTYEQIDQKETMETASRDEITLGKAYVLTVLENKTIEKVEIEITDLKKQAQPEPKGIAFKITDANFLEKTGGIIQGMSGSPIIQNDKLIGAISHVSSKDHTMGFGVYIEWMLENSNNLE